MTRPRLVTLIVAAVLAVPVALVLYLAFGDLSAHKGRIEALVTKAVGRPFAIDGAFELKVLPQISVLAERVRLANAPWGSQPQMVEVGRFSAKVGLWSLLSGPVDVRSFELSDVNVVLETDADGEGNWVFGVPREPAEDGEALGRGAAEVPAVILHARLQNVRVTLRTPKKPDRVALLETFTVDPGAERLLTIAAKGRFDEYPASLRGDVGPLDALVTGRRIRLKVQGAIGNLRLDASGGIGRLDPLDGADFLLQLENPDLATFFKNLRLPAIATGALALEARLADAGEHTRLDVDAKLGDIKAKANGTLRTLGLPGTDLRFEVAAADAGRLAAVFGATGLPAEAFTTSGRITATRSEIKLEGINASYAGAKAKADGALHVTRGPGAGAIRFALSAGSLAKLREGLPAVPLTMSGSYAGSRARLEVKDVKGRLAESEFTAWASVVRTGKRRVDAELTSPSLDLAPLLAQDPGSIAKAKSAAGARARPKPKPAEKDFIFGEEPLPLDALKGLEAKLHLVVGELKITGGALKEVDATLTAGDGRLALEGRARGGVAGTLGGSVKLAPENGGTTGLSIDLAAQDLRAGFGSGGGPIEPGQEPATSLQAELTAKGGSARQLAASANGRVLLTLGPGKVKSGLVGLVGGDMLGELASKLNPFADKDPYTQLDCVVVRADIVGGRAAVRPVLMQGEKVTVVAAGKVDLHTEELKFDFNTRPRRGIGISASMFTAPFIEIAGTLANPRLGMGTKGATAGAAAAATGGVSVLAQGLFDRMLGAKDVCKETLEQAAKPAQ